MLWWNKISLSYESIWKPEYYHTHQRKDQENVELEENSYGKMAKLEKHMIEAQRC